MSENESKPRILIVDDETENLRILTRLLKNNCKLMAAVTGTGALELAAADPGLSLILLDIMMPDMDGYEVCRRLKADNATRHIPVMFITAKSDVEDETRGFEMGAVDYITKPFNPPVVEARVQTHLELAGHRRHLEDLVNARTRDLKAGESRLSSIVDAFKGFIYTCKADGFRVDFMNQSLKNWVGDSQTGRYCHDIIFGLNTPCTWCPVEMVCKEKTVEFEIENPGNGRWYHAIYSPLFYADGTVSGRQAILFDITKRKLRENLLQEKEEHLLRENLRLKTSIKDCYRFGNIVGKSQAMHEVYKSIINASASDAGVIIYGESGTGKELVARAIHKNSRRKVRKLVSVNCGAIPESLLEREFFGHKKGAFTGADQDKAGFLEIADGGTLFLDEVAELGLNVQVKLLRAIEGSGYTPLGSTMLITPDIRIIAATNTDLKELVKKGHFREDLFYRIHILPINVPPLRERKEDIPLLVDHFLNTHNSGDRPPMNAQILDMLMSYEWPGNVRELENTLHRYVTLKHLDLIGADMAEIDHENEIVSAVTGNGPRDMKTVVERVEKQMIIDALNRNKWRRDKTAKDLGINRKALYRKMIQYGLSK